jgi:diadenosine hexaphosphate hydrolase (ATP-forming)
MSRPKRPKQPHYVDGAGGVVINQANQVLLIQYPAGTWTFPKGHIEAGERLEETALREVFEEGGVEAELGPMLGETTYVNSRGVSRRVYWFMMRTNANEAVAEPGFGAAFCSIAEARKRLAHVQNRMLLEQALFAAESIEYGLEAATKQLA